jgi:hypothetical protein
MNKPMSIATQAKMIGCIRNNFDISLSVVAELLGVERKDVADVFYKQKLSGLDTEKLVFLFIQSKRFARMNYIRPDYMFTRPVLPDHRVWSLLKDGKEIPSVVLQYLKTLDTMEAEARARGLGGKPFRSIRDAIDDISTPLYTN